MLLFNEKNQRKMKKLLLMPLMVGAYMSAHSQNAGAMFPLYVDINPDTLINYVVTPYTDENYEINLFGDATTDVKITAHGAVSSGGSSAYIGITSLSPNVYISFGRLDSVYGPGIPGWDVTKVARIYNAGDPLNPAGAIWDNTMLYLTDHSGHSGANKNVNDWVGGDKYIGLKYQSGSSTAYGWIRVQCPTEDKCYVKDYSATPATVGINELSELSATLYPNPANTSFYLKDLNAGSFDASMLKLCDMYGKDVQFTAEVMNGEVRIDLNDALPDGCYMLQYTSKNSVFSKKLVKTSR